IGGLTGVAEQEAGLASGLLNTSQQLGGGVGVAIAPPGAARPPTTPPRPGKPLHAAPTRRLPLAPLGCGTNAPLPPPTAAPLLPRGKAPPASRHDAAPAPRAKDATNQVREMGAAPLE